MERIQIAGQIWADQADKLLMVLPMKGPEAYRTMNS